LNGPHDRLVKVFMTNSTTSNVSPRAVRALIATNIGLLGLLAVSILSGFAPRRMAEPVLSVERLNIVDSTGRPLLVLANGQRLPGAMFHGKEYPQSFVGRGKSAGMIFYNAAGDEVGGLIYDGAQRDSGYSALEHLSFDQWQQNQVLALTYSDDGKSRMAGFRVWDRPNVPLEQQFAAAERYLAAGGAARDSLNKERLAARDRVAGTQRIFVGSENRNASVELRDPSGHVRARLVVDSLGTAGLEFLDATGKVTAAYPAKQ
jgi:hypothetical protein